MAIVVAERLWLIGDAASRPVTIHRSSSELIVSEGETKCTSEMTRGQFSIFGAVEEKGWPRISRINTDQAANQKYRAKPRGGRGFRSPANVGRKLLDRGEAECSQGVHRKCRKAGSGQWSGEAHEGSKSGTQGRSAWSARN